MKASNHSLIMMSISEPEWERMAQKRSLRGQSSMISKADLALCASTTLCMI